MGHGYTCRRARLIPYHGCYQHCSSATLPRGHKLECQSTGREQGSASQQVSVLRRIVVPKQYIKRPMHKTAQFVKT